MLILVGVLLVTGWWDWIVNWLQVTSSSASRRASDVHLDDPRDRRRDPTPPGDMSARELLRWTWRQLTSMRTALILLFLLALAAIPGSVIPQSDVDAFAVSRWQDGTPS